MDNNNNVYNLNEVPEGVVKRVGGDFDEFCKENENNIKWGGRIDVPELGTKVWINFNGLGMGNVSSYFIEDGWLGVKVTLDNRPDWHKKQNPDRNYALAFGAEIELR